MKDYRAIEIHIHRAHLENFALVGDVISSAIVSLWKGASRLTALIARKIKARIESPDQPKTLPPAYF